MKKVHLKFASQDLLNGRKRSERSHCVPCPLLSPPISSIFLNLNHLQTTCFCIHWNDHPGAGHAAIQVGRWEIPPQLVDSERSQLSGLLSGLNAPLLNRPYKKTGINTKDVIKELCWSQRSLAESVAEFIKGQNPTPRRSDLKPTFDE